MKKIAILSLTILGLSTAACGKQAPIDNTSENVIVNDETVTDNFSPAELPDANSPAPDIASNAQ